MEETQAFVAEETRWKAIRARHLRIRLLADSVERIGRTNETFAATAWLTRNIAAWLKLHGAMSQSNVMLCGYVVAADFMNWADKLEEGARQTMLEIRANCMPQVDALLAAGWRYELPEIVNRKDGESPHCDTEPWQWYWRRPPRRPGSKGMKFWSTQMAYNALMRERKPVYTPGQLVWFLKSMRMVKFVDVHPGGKFCTVERLEDGRQLTATYPDGISPIETFGDAGAHERDVQNKM